MAQNPQFEISPELRELAERNVEQAQQGFHQLMNAARQAQDMMGTMLPHTAASAALKGLQDRAMRFTRQNVDASFALVHDLANARDFQHALEIQSRFAQDQIQNYSRQAQELGRLMAEVAQKAQARS